MQRHFNDWRIIRHMTMRVPWPYPDDGAECFIREHCLPAMADGRMMAWVLVPYTESEAVGLLEYRVGEELTDNRGFWVGALIHHQPRGSRHETPDVLRVCARLAEAEHEGQRKG
jgi:hypothetical protein